jgi:hypothetical protein
MASCHDCGRGREKTKKCMMHNPKLARICKDCCIAKWKGHKCEWFWSCW